MMKNAYALAAVILLSAVSVRAQTALDQLSREAGVDAAPLAAQMKAVRAMDAGAPAAVAIPLHAQDALEACTVLDAKTFVAVNVQQAALMVQTCLNHAYPADGFYLVQAQPARFGVDLCPAQAGKMTCGAIVEVEGIKITVTGAINTGDSVLQDLNAALQKRGGKLMGYRAIVDNQAQIRL